MGTQIGDVFPALQQRRARRWIDPNVEAARRALWSAYQRGSLTEEELLSTLERLEFASVVQWDALSPASRSDKSGDGRVSS